MARLNEFQWTSQEHNGIGSGVGAEQLRGGVSVRVTNGTTYMGFNLTTEQADDLAKFIIDCGISERAANRSGIRNSSTDVEDRSDADVILAAADWLDCLRDEQWNGSTRRPNNYHRAAEDLRRHAQHMKGESR